MKFPLLLDAYGSLLSDRKREILDYYYNEDYSLSEISELTGISRQGVRDSVKKSEEELYGLEARLQLVARSEEAAALIGDMLTELHDLTTQAAEQAGEPTAERLQKLADQLLCVRSLTEPVRSEDALTT